MQFQITHLPVQMMAYFQFGKTELEDVQKIHYLELTPQRKLEQSMREREETFHPWARLYQNSR